MKTDKMHDTKLQIEHPTEQIGQPKSPIDIWNEWLKSGLRPYTTFTQVWEAQQKWEKLQLTKNKQQDMELTAKEKAVELMFKYWMVEGMTAQQSKACAIIELNSLIKYAKTFGGTTKEDVLYFDAVKAAIFHS